MALKSAVDGGTGDQEDLGEVADAVATGIGHAPRAHHDRPSTERSPNGHRHTQRLPLGRSEWTLSNEFAEDSRSCTHRQTGISPGVGG